jgi:hypothetical protein
MSSDAGKKVSRPLGLIWLDIIDLSVTDSPKK